MENNTKPIITSTTIAEKVGYSLALNPYTISAYHDAAKFDYPEGKRGKYAKRAFMRGWNEGYITIHKVKKEIASGELLFVKDDGCYLNILSGQTPIPTEDEAQSIIDRNDEQSVATGV